MKNFNRDNQLFSLCGLNCGLCTMHLGGYCPGCGGGPGNQACAIARCSQAHGGVTYCTQCAAYPCARYTQPDPYDTLITTLHRRRDLEKAAAHGMVAYNAEQREKIGMLHTLLEQYNDGRRKTLYSIAVNLLDLSDLRAVLHTLAQADADTARPIRERAAHAAALLQDAAAARGLTLKLRKKPGKRAPSAAPAQET